MKELDYITESYPRRKTVKNNIIEYPIAVEVAPGEAVLDGWSQHYTAPITGNKWELWQAVNTETNTLCYLYWKEVKE